MFLWKAVRFLRDPAIADLEETVDRWYRTYSAYAERHLVQPVTYPQIEQWLLTARSPNSIRFGRRQYPCAGFTVAGIPRREKARWGVISSINLWCSMVPRLEWEFDEERRRAFPKEFVRSLLRCGSIDLLAYPNTGRCLGWNYAVYAWLTFDRAKSLQRKLDRDFKEQCRKVSAFLASAQSAAESHGQVSLVKVRSRREKRELSASFEGHAMAWN